jgi:3-phosphoshikimate 1-carboxyvinyltransferase
MATLTVTPGRPLRGTISVPGDKSITHRAIIMTALANGVSSVAGYCRGEDCLNTMRAFQTLGVRIDESAEELRVYGKGLWGLTEPSGPIDCGNSGTGIRLLTGLLTGQDFRFVADQWGGSSSPCGKWELPSPDARAVNSPP